MTKKGLILATIAMFCFSAAAQAQVPPSVLQNQNRIQLEQQRLLNEEFRRKELQNALKRPKKEKTTQRTVEEEPDLVKSCVNIKNIEFSGNDKIGGKSINKAIKPYLNTCMSLADINNMLNTITNLYIEKGYISSRAFMTMPQKRIKEGILEIKIVEGKLSKIEGIKKSQIWTAFPFMTGGVLNLRDIEQGIDQINRLASNSATMEIKPDEKNEYSKLEIKNTPKGTSKFTIFTDNAGSESTGETRFGFRASQDNLLNLNEQINMSFANSPSKDYDHRDADYFTLGASIPFGYWTLNNNFSWSDYRTSFLLYNGDRFYSYGNSVTNSLSLDRMLARGQRYKISASGGLTYKRNQNYTKVLDLKMKNEVSSRDLAILNLGLSSTFYFNNGVLYLNPTYNKGTKWFGALDDDQNNYSQSAQYEAWKLYAYYSRNMFDLATYTATFDGQYSNDELYGTEAFYLGGEYSVRGFRNEGVQSDSGYALRNDLDFNVAQLAQSENEFLQGLTFGPFIDYGYVHNNNKDLKSEILSGAGGKVALNYKFFNASVGYATVLKKPKWIKENESVYLYAGLNFSFN